jgi:hypothetical protein
VLESASKEPDHPIRWDERLNEYYLAYGKAGRMMIYYCLFCGGKVPESRSSSMFAHITQDEETRIYELFRGIHIVADVIARFGQPDEEREFGGAVRSPSRDGKPERGEMFRGLVYKNLSPVAEIVFQVGSDETVQGTWSQKYIGDGRAG